MKKSLLIILFLFSVLVGCSKKADHLKYSMWECNDLAHESRPSNEKGAYEPPYEDYAFPVSRMESKALIYKGLSFFAVSFDSSEEARTEALRLNQYYARNWLFDRVEGEPVLEDYVITTFKAINPRRSIQRVPKTATPASAPAAHH